MMPQRFELMLEKISSSKIFTQIVLDRLQLTKSHKVAWKKQKTICMTVRKERVRGSQQGELECSPEKLHISKIYNNPNNSLESTKTKNI